MDLNAIFHDRLTKLQAGDHLRGLQAVRLHINAAISHHSRGRDGDATAFTDAIYRCNQAFEGSIKEAYRVLAGKDPSRTTPAKIETFLTEQNLLRQRVLDQFTNYRTGWRNASAHDYTLDFDENEALLAIVSVTVFAIVLSDQIRAKLAVAVAERAAPHPQTALPPNVQLDQEIERLVVEFVQGNSLPSMNASDFEAELAGFLAAQFAATPGIEVHVGFRLNGREADIAVRRGDERIALELKFMPYPTESRVHSGLAYLGELLARGFTHGILVALVAGERHVVATIAGASIGQSIRAIFSHSLTKSLVSGRFD